MDSEGQWTAEMQPIAQQNDHGNYKSLGYTNVGVEVVVGKNLMGKLELLKIKLLH